MQVGLRKIKNKLLGETIGNEAALSLANEELSQGVKQDDIWQIAEAKCSGDLSLTKLVYIKIRTEQLQKRADEKIVLIKTNQAVVK
jgi:hypothetical protein